MEHIVDITALAFGGRGIGRIDGKVVFVPFTAPGDRARIAVVTEKKGFSEGALVEVVSPSPLRAKPPCPVFGACGGCALQHISYEGQVEWKERIFEETLKRIGKVEGAEFGEPIKAVNPWNYRSRASFHVDRNGWGFFGEKSHIVIDIDECPIADPAVNRAFKGIKGALSGKKHGIYTVEVGASPVDGKAVAAFYIHEEKKIDWHGCLSGIEGLKGFEVRLSPERKGKGKRIYSEGDTVLSYSVQGLRFNAGIGLFSQVNPAQNERLVEKVVEYAGLSGTETVVDLFSGVGNLTLPLSKGARAATGVESSIEATEFAEENAKINGIKSASFVSSEAALWLKQEIKSLEKTRPCVIVLDPPRGGGPEVVSMLSGARPERIVYVSCSPPTLARDLSTLSACGYKVKRASFVDMFPQTYHIECVASLELGK
ncbi:MAG: 23S rRNA (uracil(1939)-C(5))-methyltransferase RlmD [Deltaproteobacteria bacterium]|nr:23S rRNA (uracil(1939)-C(5))-methyltransferase RlmD [Deltaproteobacteria bacterium]